MRKQSITEDQFREVQPGFSSAEVADIKQKIFAQRVKILHKHLFFSVPASFLCSIVVFLALYSVDNLFLLKEWLWTVVIISVLRLATAILYLLKPEHNKFYLNGFVIGTCLSAVLWGIAGSLLMPANDLIRQTIVIVIIAGITAGGVQTLQASRLACSAYIVFAILPLSLWLLLSGSTPYFILGVAMTLYLVFMLMTSWRNSSMLTRMLRFYFENIELTRSLVRTNGDLKFEISQREKMEEQLKYIATHDALTGLANRTSFETIFSQVMSRAKRAKSKFAILFIDIDNFKEINDSFGHDRGDLLLMRVAERLEAVIRGSDMVIRMGGDEFVVLLEEVSDATSVEVTTKKIFDSLKKPFILKDENLFISVSIGVSIYPDNGESKHALLKKADIALYQAKKEGKNSCVFFNNS